MKFFIYLSQVNGSLREVDAVIGQLIDLITVSGWDHTLLLITWLSHTTGER